jgi:hypothetical protein
MPAVEPTSNLEELRFPHFQRPWPQVSLAKFEQIEAYQVASSVMLPRMQQREIGNAAAAFDHALAIDQEPLDGSRRVAETIAGYRVD